MGFPLIMRPFFGLEGMGGYLVYNMEEVKDLAALALNQTPVREVILEKVLDGWMQLVVEWLHDPSFPGDVHLFCGTLLTGLTCFSVARSIDLDIPEVDPPMGASLLLMEAPNPPQSGIPLFDDSFHKLAAAQYPLIS